MVQSPYAMLSNSFLMARVIKITYPLDFFSFTTRCHNIRFFSLSTFNRRFAGDRDRYLYRLSQPPFSMIVVFSSLYKIQHIVAIVRPLYSIRYDIYLDGRYGEPLPSHAIIHKSDVGHPTSPTNFVCPAVVRPCVNTHEFFLSHPFTPCLFI